MWPNRVVVDPPSLDDLPRKMQAVEEVFVQTLISQPSIEAFNERVLRWFPRCDVVPFYDRFFDPFQDCMTGQFSAVVRDIIFGVPRRSIMRSSSRATRTPDNDMSTTMASANIGL